ncbi:MAG: c-type cytochrome, partial [Pseudobdellovibrionaceae bacterium]
YKNNCAMCHGAEGNGDGASGAGLNPKPRNLVEGNWKMGAGSIAHFKVLQNGIEGGSMASYAHMQPAERWALVHFIDSITQNKGNDTPEQIAAFAKTAK